MWYTPDKLYIYSNFVTDWTWGANWVNYTTYYQHTSGSATPLKHNVAAIINKQYLITVNATVTVWSASITIGDWTPTVISTSWTYILNIKANTTNPLTITPTSTSDFRFEVDSILWTSTFELAYKTLTNTSSLCPTLVDWWTCYIGNWNIISSIDTLWVKYD